MAKLAWNKFMGKYSKRMLFAAPVAASLPRGMEFDMQGKKLPTPYMLFIEWCQKNLNEHWSTTKIRGGLVVAVISKPDVDKISAAFDVISDLKEIKPGIKARFIGYQNSDYVSLARSLGYKLK